MTQSAIHQILDLARWAPSGDNVQPWRFEIVDDRRFVIHGSDTRDHVVYDLDGRPSQLALGCLIETASIAASAHGLALEVQRRRDMPETRPTFDVTLVSRSGTAPDPLLPAITVRATQRRSMSTRELTAAERQALEAAVGPRYEIAWLLGWPAKWQWVKLLWRNAGLRLRLPEAFEVHRSMIEWDATTSADRMPDQSLGVNLLTRKLMRSAMQSQQRVQFLNDYLGGTLLPRVEMDLVPGLACAGHAAILAREPDFSIDGCVANGRAVQRFWLTAARLGLQHQPEMTPLIFGRYVAESRRFTSTPRLQELAVRLSRRLDELLAGRAGQAVWLGRIGHGNPPVSRSVRLPLESLLVKAAAPSQQPERVERSAAASTTFTPT